MRYGSIWIALCLTSLGFIQKLEMAKLGLPASSLDIFSYLSFNLVASPAE